MAIKKLRAARVNTISAEEYVGQDGDIFWDVNTGAFRISDGVTPGGYFPPSYSTIANFGDFTAVENTLSTTNNNEDMNLVTQGTGALNFYGGGGFIIHTDGPDSPAAFSVQPNGFTTVYVPNLVTGDSGVVINASNTGHTLPTQVQGVPLHIVGQEDKLAPINVDSFGAGVNPGLTGRAARGTAQSPSSTQTGDVIGRFAAVGYGNTAYTIDPSATNGKAPTDIRFVALENFTDAHSGSQIQFATAAIGSATRQVVATLDTTAFSTSVNIHTSGNLTVDGNEIIAKQLIITQAGNIAFNDGSIQTTAAIQTIDNLDHITGAFAVVGVSRHLQLSSDATPSNTPGTIVSRNNQGNVSVGNITATNISTTSVTGNAQIAGSMFIAGNLLVNGTTTSVNSGAVSIGTKTLTVSNAAATSSQADGSAFLVGNDGVYGDWTFDSVQSAWRSNINIVPAQASTGSIGSNDRHWASVYTNICNVDTQLQVGTNPFTYIVDSLGQFTGNGNVWSMVSTQNLNMGNNASSDFVAIADNGNDVTNFIDMGINSSTYNQTAYGVMKPLDGYLFTNGGNLVIGTQSTQKDIVFFTGGSTSDKGAGRIIGTGQRWLIGTPADDGVSKLQVQGNILAGNITATNLTNTFTSLQNQLTGANAAIVTANTAMKSYVDAVTTAWTANAATQQGQITTLQGQVYTNSNVAAYLPTYTGNITAGNVNVTGNVSANFYKGNVMLAAGTTSVSPLTFQAGSLLTTAQAGAMNYDGTTLYFTPAGLQRGIIPAEQFYVTGADRSYTPGSGAQTSVLGVGVTLTGGIRYHFAFKSSVTKAGGGGQALSFAFGGTATLGRVTYYYVTDNNANIIAGSINKTSSFSTGDALTANVNAGVVVSLEIFGYIDVATSGGGTVIPTIGWSATPGAVTVNAHSSMRIFPIGASGSSDTSIGTWA